MAGASEFTATGTTKSQQSENPNERDELEMTTFKSSYKIGSTKSMKPEAISSSYNKLLLKIFCVGDYSGSWNKQVYIKDYVDESLSKSNDYAPIIGVDFALKKLHDTSGNEIKLLIWIMNEVERFNRRNMFNIFYKNANGAIVFWGANSSSMDSAVKWKQHVSLTQPNIPFVLVVDNAYRTPVKWIGQGLVMNSTDEMNNFCMEHGFFAWFEMFTRGAGVDSVFGQAMTTLVNEIRSTDGTSSV